LKPGCPPLTDGGEFRAELMVNWENILEDWMDDDDLNAELDTIATLGGETLLGFIMLEYSHSFWLNDLEHQQATHLGLFVPVPLKGESLMVMPSIGADFWSEGRTEAELELATGADAIVPYASLTLVSALGEDLNFIASARQQYLPETVTDLNEVNTDRRNEFILALEDHI